MTPYYLEIARKTYARNARGDSRHLSFQKCHMGKTASIKNACFIFFPASPAPHHRPWKCHKVPFSPENVAVAGKERYCLERMPRGKKSTCHAPSAFSAAPSTGIHQANAIRIWESQSSRFNFSSIVVLSLCAVHEIGAFAYFA